MLRTFISYFNPTDERRNLFPTDSSGFYLTLLEGAVQGDSGILNYIINQANTSTSTTGFLTFPLSLKDARSFDQNLSQMIIEYPAESLTAADEVVAHVR